MTDLLRTPVTYVWLLLMAATGGSLWVTVDHGIDLPALATAIVMTVAVAKVYLIGMFFMELRHAPLVLRAAFNVWCAACWVAVVGVYVAN